MYPNLNELLKTIKKSSELFDKLNETEREYLATFCNANDFKSLIEFASKSRDGGIAQRIYKDCTE